PPEHLVVRGLYRYVRNPMYLAVLAVILGQALLLGRAVLVGYAAIVAAAFVAFVYGYEQPNLTRRYGAEYAAYRRRGARGGPPPRARRQGAPGRPRRGAGRASAARGARGGLCGREPAGHLVHERRADRLLHAPGEQPLPDPGGVEPGQARQPRGQPGRVGGQ